MIRSDENDHIDKRPRREGDTMGAAEVAVLFANATARLEAAQKELALAQVNMMDARHRIRAAGYFEPDSLLSLSDGEDDHILSNAIDYLTVEEAGRWELVCHAFTSGMVNNYWEKLDKSLLSHQSLRSPSAGNARERVIRYHLASSLAKRIGSMGERISNHLFDTYIDMNSDSVDRRVHDCCKGCDFPEELDFRVLQRDAADNFELFVRFSRTRDNYLFAEGFLPLEIGDHFKIEIPLRTLDFSERWPQTLEVTHLVENNHEEEPPFDEALLEECMRELTVSVIAVDKTSSHKASLVMAQSDFAGRLDNMENRGYCWPQGRISKRSHGDIVTRTTYAGSSDDFVTYAESQDPSAALGMKWVTVTQTDPNDNDRVMANECEWTLSIDVNFPRG